MKRTKLGERVRVKITWREREKHRYSLLPTEDKYFATGGYESLKAPRTACRDQRQLPGQTIRHSRTFQSSPFFQMPDRTNLELIEYNDDYTEHRVLRRKRVVTSVTESCQTDAP